MLKNGLLLSSGNGTMMVFDTKSRQVVPLSEEMEKRLLAQGSVVQAACLLENNTILLSTSKNGLFEMNLLTHSLIGEGDVGFTIPVPDAYVTHAVFYFSFYKHRINSYNLLNNSKILHYKI